MASLLFSLLVVNSSDDQFHLFRLQRCIVPAEVFHINYLAGGNCVILADRHLNNVALSDAWVI